MRLGKRAFVAIVLFTACHSSRSGPVTPTTPAAATEPIAATATAPTPPAGPMAPVADDELPPEPPPPPPADPPAPPSLVSKLPKPDFAPALRLAKVDAAKEKEANKLNIAGLKLHRKKDFAAAEVQYQAALTANPGHLIARYNLACVLNLGGQSDKGLALLVQLQTAPGCDECGQIVEHTRFDDDWRSQWAEPVLREVLALVPQAVDSADEPDAGEPDEPDEPAAGDEHQLTCPKGTKQKGTWRDDRDLNEIYCAKPNGTKHGPYWLQELGYEMSEGVRSEQGDYKDGVKDGLWSSNESFGMSTYGAYKNGKEHGLWVTYHKDETGYLTYVDGKQEGRSQLYRDEYLVSESQYEKGVLHGPYKQWTDYVDEENPYVLREEGAWDHGKQHGTLVSYDTAGKKRSVGNWDRGKRHGTFEYWDDQGKLLGKTTMDHDTGDWVAYSNDGEKTEEGHLTAGVRDGRWGETDLPQWLEGTYDRGKRVGVWASYAKRGGAKLSEGAYKAGKRSGAWTYWREDGSVVGKGVWADGKLDGTWVVYDEKGAQAQELVFRKGKLTKVNGEKASNGYQRGLEDSRFEQEPVVIEPVEEDPDAGRRY